MKGNKYQITRALFQFEVVVNQIPEIHKNLNFKDLGRPIEEVGLKKMTSVDKI